MGIVFNPFTNELFQVTEESVTTLNGRKLPLTKWQSIEKGVLAYHFARDYREQVEKILEMWEDRRIGKLVSPGGSPVYALANVAKGSQTALVMCPNNREPFPWDLTAGKLFVEKAGGQITDLEGNPIDPLAHQDYLVASTVANVHEQMLKTLEEYGIGKT